MAGDPEPIPMQPAELAGIDAAAIAVYRGICTRLGASVEERQAAERRRRAGGDRGAWVRFEIEAAARDGWDAWAVRLAYAVWLDAGIWQGDQVRILRALGLEGEAAAIEGRYERLFEAGIALLRGAGAGESAMERFRREYLGDWPA